MSRTTSLLLLCLVLILAACGEQDGDGEAVPTTAGTVPTLAATANSAQAENGGAQPEAAAPTATNTPAPPTATPEPLAALVNGTPVPLAAYQAELVREELLRGSYEGYQSAVLNRLIDQQLIAQAATGFGIELTDEMVAANLAEVRSQLEETNGPSAYTDWLAANLYSEEEFAQFWRFDMLQRLVLAEVVADVGLTDEHVRARYLQVNDEALALDILVLLNEGNDFGDLARQYSLDETTGEFGGELDYFTHGELLVPELETAAFALGVGEHSEIIRVTNPENGTTTFYLIEVLDRAVRDLHTDTYYTRQQARWSSWLADQRANAAIEIYVPLN
ncbi:MAG: peptidylprolyl isomerase [Ardenticatenales bacterium]|nr:peptidylprolyl isomerase [Ardenticatenales bacterium]